MAKPEKKTAEEPEKKKPPTGDVTVEHDDEPEEPDVELGAGEGDLAPEDHEPRVSRDDRRRQRGNVIAELETERRRTRDLEDRATRAESMLRDNFTRGAPPEPRRDDIQTELETVYDEQEQLSTYISNMAGKLDPEAQKKVRARAMALRIRENELITKRVMRQNAPDPEEAETRAAIASIRLDFPQVKDPKVYNRARAIYYQKQSDGEENSMSLWRSSVKQARSICRSGLRSSKEAGRMSMKEIMKDER